MPEQIVIGVDVGSGAARALAVTPSGRVVATGSADYSGGRLAIGEVDPATWLEGAVAAVAAVGLKPAAICIGGHGPTTVASSGQRALTFRHPAGESSSPPEQHAAQTQVLREEFGDQVEPRQLWDWVLSRLGARSDSQSVWPGSRVLPEFGEVVPVGSLVGETNGEFGLPSGIPLVPGSNDAYMTAWAGGIDVPGRGFDPGGKTGGLGVAVESGEYEDAASYGMPSSVAGVYIVGGPVAAHGAILDWWSDITGRSVSDLMELAAKVPAGSHGVMALPFLEGERAPRWNPDLRAEIVGLHIDHDVGVIARALLESTAYGLGHIAQDLAAQGVVLERLVCSGGPAQSALWTSIKAAVLDVPIDVPSCDEMAAYGAALGAGAALDWWPRPGEGKAGDWPVPEMTTIDPEPLDVYRAGQQRFIELGDAAAAKIQ
jgi:xylulokinase